MGVSLTAKPHSVVRGGKGLTMNRFKRNLYSVEAIVFRNRHHRYITSDDGTLFYGQYRTKILPQDLPEWYVYGRYYKRFGYLSTKGITDLLYVPCKVTNHFLKDDALYISYSGKIMKNPEPPKSNIYHFAYIGYDETVWGSEIISTLKGARLYSGYDISGIIEQIKEKKAWLINEYPDEFGPDRWEFDVDECFSQPLENRIPPKLFAISLDDHFRPSFSSFPKRYYGTLQQIQAVVEALNYDKHKGTVDAFHRYMNGECDVTHIIAYKELRLLEPVTHIKDAYLYLIDRTWDFKNVWGSTYKMQVHSAHMNAVLIIDGDRYIRCICPDMEGLSYSSEVDNYTTWHPINSFWGHPGILAYKETERPKVICNLYLPEREYDDVKQAVAELNTADPILDVVCEDIFGDG